MPGDFEVEEDQIGGMPKWKVEGDLRSVQDAEEIRKDPKRRKAVKMLAKKQMDALKLVTGGPGGFRSVGAEA